MTTSRLPPPPLLHGVCRWHFLSDRFGWAWFASNNTSLVPHQPSAWRGMATALPFSSISVRCSLLEPEFSALLAFGTALKAVQPGASVPSELMLPSPVTVLPPLMVAKGLVQKLFESSP